MLRSFEVKIAKIFFYGAIFVVIGAEACLCTTSQTNVIKEYDNASELAKDLCKFVGIPEMENTSEVVSPLTQQRKNVIIFWDCDNVLQKNTDPTLSDANIWRFLKDVEDKNCKETAIWKSPKTIVEQSILDLTYYLKRYEVPQFVFTQCTSDTQTRFRRERILKQLGYSFEDTVLGQKVFELKVDCELALKPGQTTVSSPIYDGGVIYTGGATKEGTAGSFFDVLKASGKFVSPKDWKVAFIDDKKHNLDEVKECCRKYGVKEYKGFCYTKALNPENSETSRSPTIEAVQKYCLKSGKFLGYNDARFLLKLFPTVRLRFEGRKFPGEL